MCWLGISWSLAKQGVKFTEVTVSDPEYKLPWLIYLEAGKHTVTMENVSEGMNLDYFVLHDYTLVPTRSPLD